MDERSWTGRRAAALVAIGAAAAFSCGEKGPSPRAECEAAWRARTWDRAIETCREAIAADPQPKLEAILADSLDRAGQSEEALPIAERLFGTEVDATAREIAGTVREKMDQLDVAQALIDRALAGHLAAGDHAGLARTLHIQVRIFYRQSRLSAALAAAQRAVAEAELAKDPLLRGRVMLGLARVLTAVGDERQARRALAEAGSLLGPSPREQLWRLQTHGMLLLELEDLPGAVRLLTEASDLAMQLGRPDVRQVYVSAQINLAYAERKLGQLDAAQRRMKALDPKVRATGPASYVEGLIAADRGDSATAERLLATASEDPPDDDYVRDIAYQRGLLAQRRGDAAAAEAFFRDSIATIETIRERTTDLELRSWVLRGRRTPYQALFALLAGQHRDLDALEVAEKLQARSWRDSLASASAPRPGQVETSPQGAQASLGAPPPTLSGAALVTLVGRREALLFVDAGASLWRFRIARGQVALAELGADTAGAVDAWLAAPDDDALAALLGAALVPREVAAGAEPLYIATGDRLASLPFAALRRGSRRLIDDRPLVRVPGLVGLECTARVAPAGTPVVLGDPGGDLPAARSEAERIAKVLSAAGAYVGGQATTARLFAASGAPLLHVAAHADIDQKGGVLALADGRVSAAEILGKRVAPALVVLAGCATSASRQPEGWGSLASSFLAAGTPTVVATLRPMGDADASAVFEQFYRAGGATRPAFALAQAQRTLARTRRPHEWSTVAVWGAPEPAACAPLTPTGNVAAGPKP